MADSLKSDLKAFAKKLKEFKKVSQKDMTRGEELAKELKYDCIYLKSRSDVIKQDSKEYNQIVKTEDIIRLYIKSVKDIQAFKQKYD